LPEQPIIIIIIYSGGKEFPPNTPILCISPGVKHSSTLKDKKSKGPRPGFEPELRDPQSLMLPDYTTSAIIYFEIQNIQQKIIDYISIYFF
jgi:hypothetical protein